VNLAGNIIVADTNNHLVQQFGPDGSFIQAFSTKGSGPGQFSTPASMVVDSAGNIIMADSYNHQVQQFGPDRNIIVGDDSQWWMLETCRRDNHVLQP
jgi:hypothetical protein